KDYNSSENHNSSKDRSNSNNNHETTNTMKAGYSSLQLYWTRPTELQNISLFQLYLNYKYVKGEWKCYTKDNIVHIWPQPSLLQNRNILQLTENKTFSWKELYDRHLQEIESGPTDLLEPAMIIAETSPDTLMYDSLDLGLHSIDLSYNWARKSKERYPTLMDANAFIQRACNENIEDYEINNSIDTVIDYDTLNEKQKIILDRIE
ncbi:11052_t:CDS:2, partial [Racocetra persica]